MANRAVIIGVGGYLAGSNLMSHPEIANSAREYARFLRTDPRWQGAEDQVHLLVKDSPDQSGEQLAVDVAGVPDSFIDVMVPIEQAAAAAGPGDTLLITYVGHGNYWTDRPAAQVHFAVGTTRRQKEYTWLSTSHVYRAMKGSAASTKILIADSCCANYLHNLGADGKLPGDIGEADEGTYVLTAVGGGKGKEYEADAKGCGNIPDESLKRCTSFSGHLLDILKSGTDDSEDELTLTMIVEELNSRMRETCSHPKPRLLPNVEPPDRNKIFRNNRIKERREGSFRREPELISEWVSLVNRMEDPDLSRLFADPKKARRVVDELLSGSFSLGHQVDQKARDHYHRDLDSLSTYWGEIRKEGAL